ncbi:hypothetical protein HYT26_00845 [Candidatus Pacearchaeota archaeon]|nr:hypothetical protein [Candidatus Pacearchaeota archaeon]
MGEGDSSKAYIMECRGCKQHGHFRQFRISIAKEYELEEENGNVHKTWKEPKTGKELRIAAVKCKKCHSSDKLSIVREEKN